MELGIVSLFAVAIIVAAVIVAWSGKFLAVGALIIANLVIYVLTEFGPTSSFQGESVPTIIAELGLWPGNLTENPALAALQFFTSMFVHAGFGHLFGNLIVLIAFALAFEEQIGHRRFLLVYLVSGLVAGATQLVSPGDPKLLVGASGAIFGIIGAFAATYPNLIVAVPIPALVLMFFVRMRVWIGAIIFTAMQLVFMAITGTASGVGYFAHLGGMAAGAALGWVLVYRLAPVVRSPAVVNFDALVPFAKDAGSLQALAHMKGNQDEPQVFQVWYERFLRTASCPECNHKVTPHRHGGVVCAQGHRKDLQDRAQRA